MSDSQHNPSEVIYSEDSSDYGANKESIASEHFRANNGSVKVEMAEEGNRGHEENGHKGSLYIKKKNYEEYEQEVEKPPVNVVGSEIRQRGQLLYEGSQRQKLEANSSTIAVLSNHVEIFNNVPVSSLMQYDQDREIRVEAGEGNADVEDNDKVQYSDEEYYRESYTSNSPNRSTFKMEKEQIHHEKEKGVVIGKSPIRYQSQESSEDDRIKEERQLKATQPSHVATREKQIIVNTTQTKQYNFRSDPIETQSHPQEPQKIKITSDKPTQQQNIRNNSEYTQEINESREYMHNLAPASFHEQQINQSRYSEQCKLDLLANLKVVPVGNSEYSQKQLQRKLFKTDLQKDSVLILSKKQEEYVPIEPSPPQSNVQSLRHESVKVPRTQTKHSSDIKQQQPEGKPARACKCEIM